MSQFNVLSLGAGVQSSAVLLMSCRGDLPKLDAAIFADTQWEPAAVYEYLDWLEKETAKAVPIYRVTAGNLRKDALKSQVRGVKADGERWASMPLYTKAPDGSMGMIRRQCTKEYKIEPITKKIRELLGYKPRKRIPPGSVKQWFGISRDEVSRMRDSSVKWIENYYPLILGPISYTRKECTNWLRDRYDVMPTRSACIGCPFHSNAEWRQIKADPVQWADAVEFDNSIRNCGGMRGLVYLHRTCKPLEEVELLNLEDRGQRNWINECEGMCGV